MQRNSPCCIFISSRKCCRRNGRWGICRHTLGHRRSHAGGARHRARAPPPGGKARQVGRRGGKARHGGGRGGRAPLGDELQPGAVVLKDGEPLVAADPVVDNAAQDGGHRGQARLSGGGGRGLGLGFFHPTLVPGVCSGTNPPPTQKPIQIGPKPLSFSWVGIQRVASTCDAFLTATHFAKDIFCWLPLLPDVSFYFQDIILCFQDKIGG